MKKMLIISKKREYRGKNKIITPINIAVRITTKKYISKQRIYIYIYFFLGGIDVFIRI